MVSSGAPRPQPPAAPRPWQLPAPAHADIRGPQSRPAPSRTPFSVAPAPSHRPCPSPDSSPRPTAVPRPPAAGRAPPRQLSHARRRPLPAPSAIALARDRDRRVHPRLPDAPLPGSSPRPPAAPTAVSGAPRPQHLSRPPQQLHVPALPRPPPSPARPAPSRSRRPRPGGSSPCPPQLARAIRRPRP
ncbi:vegetative cell wall protein gp1-like [Miscanthus floridulus]|uniref:vegetative cell wall protein gp1-like n=1 Tax=Miscanthus floridulus TaxID=154761 RepID=UPI0034584C9C